MPLLFSFFCLAICISCVSKDGMGAEESLPVEEAVDELPVLVPQEVSPKVEPVDEPQEEVIEEPVVEDEDNEVVAIVNDVVITKQEHLQTKSEVEDVVESLNRITRQKDYSRWLTYLDGEYRQTLSDRGYLDQISKSLPKALRDRRIALTSIKDYFEYVFVPSRQNIRVDDIQYITPSRVYVIMDISEGRHAAVYILEKGDDGKWKLADRN